MTFQDIENAFFHETKKPLKIRWGPASWCTDHHIYLRIKADLAHEVAHAFDFVLGDIKAESFLGFNYEQECIKNFGRFDGYHEEDWADLAEPFVEKWIESVVKNASEGI